MSKSSKKAQKRPVNQNTQETYDQTHKKGIHPDESPMKKKRKNEEEIVESEHTDTELDREEIDNSLTNTEEWSAEDIEELCGRMNQQIPKGNKTKWYRNQRKLDWEKIQFKQYTSEECLAKWRNISRKIRKYRTLHELIDDVTSNIPAILKPKPPSTSRILYLKEKFPPFMKKHPDIKSSVVFKTLNENFSKMSDKKKRKYEAINQQLVAEYNEQMKIFREIYPEEAKAHRKKTPVKKKATKKAKPKSAEVLYIESKINAASEEGDKTETKELRERFSQKWSKLKESKKEKWIEKALKYHQDDKNADGRPFKPPMSGYHLFFQEQSRASQLSTVPNKDIFKHVVTKWKQLSEVHRSAYKERSRVEKDKYKEQMLIYIQQLPEEEQETIKQKEHLVKTPKKRQKPSISALFLFMQVKRPAYKLKNPTISGRQITRIMTIDYQNLSDVKKEKYRKLESEEKEKYQKRISKHLENLQDNTSTESEKPPEEPPVTTLKEVEKNRQAQFFTVSRKQVQSSSSGNTSTESEKPQIITTLKETKKLVKGTNHQQAESVNVSRKQVHSQESSSSEESSDDEDEAPVHATTPKITNMVKTTGQVVSDQSESDSSSDEDSSDEDDDHPSLQKTSTIKKPELKSMLKMTPFNVKKKVDSSDSGKESTTIKTKQIPRKSPPKTPKRQTTIPMTLTPKPAEKKVKNTSQTEEDSSSSSSGSETSGSESSDSE